MVKNNVDRKYRKQIVCTKQKHIKKLHTLQVCSSYFPLHVFIYVLYTFLYSYLLRIVYICTNVCTYSGNKKKVCAGLNCACAWRASLFDDSCACAVAVAKGRRKSHDGGLFFYLFHSQLGTLEDWNEN